MFLQGTSPSTKTTLGDIGEIPNSYNPVPKSNNSHWNQFSNIISTCISVCRILAVGHF